MKPTDNLELAGALMLPASGRAMGPITKPPRLSPIIREPQLSTSLVVALHGRAQLQTHPMAHPAVSENESI